MGKTENFDELLFRLNQNDEGKPLEEDDFNELIGDLKGKIDGIKYFISKCEAESKRLAEDYLIPIAKRKQACDNSVKTLKNWVTQTMIKQKYPYLEGDLFKVKIQEKKGISENGGISLDAKSFLKYKGLIKRSYSWDKKALGAAFKSDPEKYKNIATPTKTSFIRFSIKSGEKK